MNARELFQRLSLVLALLVGGAPAAWGEWVYNRVYNDEGGGQYTFHAEKSEYANRYIWNAVGFKTQKTLNFADVQLNWEFDFRVANLAPSFYIENLRFEGEVYVVNGDNSVQQIGTWSKTKSS
ncbi:MAG: hypothetical protein IJ615_07210, partial [Bacteroidaceae bacterium]|nr:hypothetical protein [Bacteroidaceae bacterium]